MTKEWIDAAIEFYDVMRRKTEEENAHRAAAEYNAGDDFAKSIEEAYALIRMRKAAGGESWEPK